MTETSAHATGDTRDPERGGDAASAATRAPLPGRLVYAVTGGVAGIWLLLDQATKVLAVALLPRQAPMDVAFDGLVQLQLVRNVNAAFNIPGFTGMFVIVSVLVIALVVRALRRTDRLSLALSYGLVTGGATGNLMDRLFRAPGFPDGGVVDFIKIGWWPTFNLADVGIVSGAALIVVLLVIIDREERQWEEARSQHRSVRPETAGPQG